MTSEALTHNFYFSHSRSNRFCTNFNQLLHTDTIWQHYYGPALPASRVLPRGVSDSLEWNTMGSQLNTHTHNLMNICFPVFIKVDSPVMHFKPYSLPAAANLISHRSIGSPIFLIYPLYPLLLPITFPNKLLANKTFSQSLLFGPLRLWQKVSSLNQQREKLRMRSKNSASTFGLIMTEVSPATSPWFPDSWVMVMGEIAPNMGSWFKVYCILWVYTNLSRCDLPNGTTESLLYTVTVKLEKNLSSSSACSFHVLSTTFLHLVFEAGDCNPPHPSSCLIHRMVSKRNLKNGDRKRM